MVDESAELTQAREEVKKLNDELEQRVKERTANLDAANQKLRAEIAERQRADEEIHRSERDLAEAQRVAKLGNWSFDIATNTVRWSDELLRIFDVEKTEFDGSFEAFISRVDPEDRPRIRQVNSEAKAGKDSFEIEYRVTTRSDEMKIVREIGYSTKDSDGNVVSLFGTAQDITERKRAEEALRRSECNFRNLADKSLQGISIFQDRTMIYANPAQLAILGYSIEELISMSAEQLIALTHPLDRAIAEERARKRWAGEEIPPSVEVRIVRKDGATRWIHSFNNPIEYNGQPAILSTSIDITERKEAEKASMLLRSLLDHSNDAIEVIAPETGRFLDVNAQACLSHGYTRAEYLALTVPEIDPTPAIQSWSENVENLRRSGGAVFESEHRRKDGSVFPVEVNATYVRLDRDYLLAVVRDITERKQAEQALRQSEDRFRELTGAVEDVFWIMDTARAGILYISPAYEKIWGRSCQSLYDAPHSWLEGIHPEDRERVRHAVATRQNEGSYNEEYRVVRPDGQVRWIRDRAFPVRNASGQLERVVGVARDVTERRQLEDQFLQSQKMEAIGQLAGGVAHDFNNILTVIIMQCELATTIKQTPEKLQQDFEQIREAAERAAHLTRQLLLFSRRQVMQPQVLDLNETVTNLVKMLQRIIGEDVRLQLSLHSTPLITRADPGMLDQVLMNLAINARDAMPDGGRLSIETAAKAIDEATARLHPDAVPGGYICLTVGDTGGGILPEILPRIFEPFFTTKELGKGTGLGLATIYGIVQQHRGWVEVQSQPGQGARFQVFLPASEAPPPVSRDVVRPKPHGGTETILLVEDEAPVRLITQALLEQFGYRVLPAANGVEALKVWEEHRSSIALLLTDLVMPGGISGQQLARRLEEDQPSLRVIFTSGYSAEIAGRNIELRAGENFLQKPFPSVSLLETIRRTLDA